MENTGDEMKDFDGDGQLWKPCLGKGDSLLVIFQCT